MLDKLRRIEKQYTGLEARMEQPETWADPDTYSELTREQRRLQPIVEAFRRYEHLEDTAREAESLLAGGVDDAEFRTMLREELQQAKDGMEQLYRQMQVLLLPRDPNDERNVIVEIRGGVGGEESALFAHTLYRMYAMYADAHKCRTEIANLSETELGGIREVSFLIEGEGAWSRLKFESGVHRVQRVPETEAGGRIHTSTVTVAVLPEADEVDVRIDPGELQIDTFRSSGAGGQHVNKTESAIRITHLPTGMVVECQDERSQYKNKDRAMKILASRLYEQQRQKQEAAIAAERRSQVGTGMRNERIRTYNFPQGRVTDHRIGLTLYRLDQILNGDLDELIDALVTADQAEKLREQAEHGN